MSAAGARIAGTALAVLSMVAGCGPTRRDLSPAQLTSLRLTSSGGRLLDDLGRQVVLRGVNTGSRAKLPPFMPFEFRDSGLPEQAGSPPFERALALYLDRVEAWGHNVVRVPFSWEALEPDRGEYDEAYLARYAALIAAASARGLRVIVDFHQDSFARPLCGNGFPLWTLPQPVPERPADCSGWFLGYLTNSDVKEAFDRFWSNEEQIRGAFAAMWRHVAARTWIDGGVIGFEIINEPSGGTADDRRWSEEVLAPFYAEIAAVIRASAPDSPILVDVTAMSAISAETMLPRPRTHDLIFAPHYYDAALFLGDGWAGDDPGGPIARWQATADDWGVPMILGEFGAPIDEPRASEYLRRCYQALDAQLAHGTVWEYSSSASAWNDVGFSLVDRDGQERPQAKEVTRAYPAAVDGAIRSFTYDPARRVGSLVFLARAGGLSEVVLPRRVFGDQVEVEIDAPGAVSWAYDASAQRLLIEVGDPGEVSVAFLAP